MCVFNVCLCVMCVCVFAYVCGQTLYKSSVYCVCTYMCHVFTYAFVVYMHMCTCACMLILPPPSPPLLHPLLLPAPSSSTPSSSPTLSSPITGASQALTRSPFGSGPLPIIVGRVYCTGNEAQFANCSGVTSDTIPFALCNSNTVAGVRCVCKCSHFEGITHPFFLTHFS